jgi:tetratricopeptide (TPR) repeat protein
LNRFAEAENILAAALKRNPKDADALLQRAELRLRSGKPDDAEKDLKMVIHFSPDSSLAHIALARAYEAKGLASNQQQELQEALRLNPASLPARLALGYSFIASKQGRAALEVIAAAPDEQKGQWLWMVGHNWALITLGNLQEARAGIERALGQDRPPEAVYQSAVVRLLQKDYAGAHTQVEELLKRDGADMRAAQLLMEIYASQRELAKGLDRLKEVASARPSSAPLQNLLGRWYLRSGNLAAARQACEAAKAADPQFLPADLSLGEIDIREGRNVAARQRLDAIVSANPTNITALLLSAQADDQAGDTAAAIARFRTINSLDSSNPTALNNLAYMLAPNAPDEALTYAQKAAEMVPDSPDVQDTLGWIYYRKGLFTMAVRYLQTAVDKESTPQRQFHLGMCYLKVGDQLRGQKTVREALAKDPNLAKTEQGW